MNTLLFDLAETEWTEILGDNNAFSMQIATSNNVRLHFNVSNTPPDIDAPFILIESYTPRFDFDCQSQFGNSHVWAMADKEPAKIVVVRRKI